MNVYIEDTLKRLLELFAISMAAEGRPNKGMMKKTLEKLCAEAVAQRERKIIRQIQRGSE